MIQDLCPQLTASLVILLQYPSESMKPNRYRSKYLHRPSARNRVQFIRKPSSDGQGPACLIWAVAGNDCLKPGILGTREDFAIVSDGVGGVGNTSHSTAREEEQNFQGLQRQ